MEFPKSSWLRCHVSEGQFSCEYAIAFKNHQGETLSLFANRRDVRGVEPCDNPRCLCVSGYMHVDVLDSIPPFALVRLPSPMINLHGSSYVTVQLSDLLDEYPASA